MKTTVRSSIGRTTASPSSANAETGLFTAPSVPGRSLRARQPEAPASTSFVAPCAEQRARTPTRTASEASSSSVLACASGWAWNRELTSQKCLFFQPPLPGVWARWQIHAIARFCLTLCKISPCTIPFRFGREGRHSACFPTAAYFAVTLRRQGLRRQHSRESGQSFLLDFGNYLVRKS